MSNKVNMGILLNYLIVNYNPGFSLNIKCPYFFQTDVQIADKDYVCISTSIIFIIQQKYNYRIKVCNKENIISNLH